MQEDIMDKEVHTIGEMLKNARMSQKKDLEVAAADLCIRKSYLAAIEDMDLEHIPPMPYCLGFVRSYAKYLGLNSDRIVASYRQFLNGEEPIEDDVPEQESVPETAAPHLKHIFFAVLGLSVLLIAWSVLPFSENVEEYKEDTSAEIVSEPIIVQEENDTEESVAEKDIEAAEEEKTEEKEVEEKAEIPASRLQIVLTGSSWLELKNGAKVLINGIHTRGYKYDIPNEKGWIITVGKPQYVQFYLEGKPVKIVSATQRKNVSLDKFVKE